MIVLSVLLVISIALNLYQLVASKRLLSKLSPVQTVVMKAKAPQCPICGDPLVGKLYRSTEGRWGCHHCIVVKLHQIPQGVN